MQSHIPTKEAKELELPGSDVYKYTHALYQNDIHRDFGVVRLNIEAIKAFSDTITISKRHDLLSEKENLQKWIDKEEFSYKHPSPRLDTTQLLLEFCNYEYLKIAAAFELHLKARLLSKNYVIHKINSKLPIFKNLAKEQKDRPIKKDELFNLSSYYFDGQKNYLTGITDKSIDFSLLTQKEHYKAALFLTKEQLNVIEDYRELRNQIHFPGDTVDTPHLHQLKIPITQFLIAFINQEIIFHSNKLIKQHKMNFQLLNNFEEQ